MILRPRRLADALAANTLPEAQKFHYLLLWAVSGVFLEQRGSTWDSWTGSRVAFIGVTTLIISWSLVG